MAAARRLVSTHKSDAVFISFCFAFANDEAVGTMRAKFVFTLMHECVSNNVDRVAR